MNGDILPITDEQAQAVQEAFKFGGQSLELARSFAAYVTSILGTVPEDLVGLLGGDWLRAKRAENINRVFESARARLNAAGVEAAEAVSLSVAIPLLRGAADEDRGDLVDLWGSLLAAAMTPGLSTRVRRSFAETLQRMEPLDARVFQGVQQYQSFAGECEMHWLGTSAWVATK